MINAWTVAVTMVTTVQYVCVWFKKDRYISLASPALPLNAKTLQAHKTKASMLGLSTLGQQGKVRERESRRAAGSFNYLLGKKRWKADQGGSVVI